MIGIIVTTYNRPEALIRSLPQICALGAPVLVVDDGSQAKWTDELVRTAIADYLYIPHNRGLAAALNIGLSYWLADKSVDWISYFQDDVDVHPEALKILSRLHGRVPLLTGHDAGEHNATLTETIDGIPVKHKLYIRATHMHASAEFWRSVYPIPTNELGTPKRKGPGKGMGSNVDWWIVRDSPHSTRAIGKDILCVPGLVRSFLWRGENSCWGNTAKAGEEPPLKTWAS
jgi:glycosyltransferase involved in cell wall biosynthesis